MSIPTTGGDRRGPRVAAVTAVAAALLLAGCGAPTDGTGGARSGSSGTGGAASAASTSPTSRTSTSTRTPGAATSSTGQASGSASSSSTSSASWRGGRVLPASPPTRVRIPSIGVDHSGLVRLGRTSDGGIQPPKSFSAVGWYDRGPTPGQLGPAVIAAHVDSTSGPAVFFHLEDVAAGDAVRVTREDGTHLRFVVDRVRRYPKSSVPVARVYGKTSDRPELRLVTCGGDFDASTGHYVDNVVVFAHLTSVRG